MNVFLEFFEIKKKKVEITKNAILRVWNIKIKNIVSIFIEFPYLQLISN